MLAQIESHFEAKLNEQQKLIYELAKNDMSMNLKIKETMCVPSIQFTRIIHHEWIKEVIN